MKYLLTAGHRVVLALLAKNMVRSVDRPQVDGGARHGRGGRGDRHPPDADQAAQAFAISSFYCGVAGALYAYMYLGTVEPEASTSTCRSASCS
jgi:branched-chain amino acid transport system permease protein